MPTMLGAPTARGDGQRIGLRAAVSRRPCPPRGARAGSPAARPAVLGRGSRRVRGGGAACRRGCRHGRCAVGCARCDAAGRRGCRHGRCAVGCARCDAAGRHGSRHGRCAVGCARCDAAGRHGSRHGRCAVGCARCDAAGRHGSRHGRRAVGCRERHRWDSGWHWCWDSPATAGSDRSGCAAEHEHADERERPTARHASNTRRPAGRGMCRDFGALVVTLRRVDQRTAQLGEVVHGDSLSRSRRFRRPRLTRWRATLGEQDRVWASSA